MRFRNFIYLLFIHSYIFRSRYWLNGATPIIWVEITCVYVCVQNRQYFVKALLKKYSLVFFFKYIIGFGAKTEKLEVHSFCLKMWTFDVVVVVISIIIIVIITLIIILHFNSPFHYFKQVIIFSKWRGMSLMWNRRSLLRIITYCSI